MTEEKKAEIKECNCFCKSEGFRNFLITALGTFVGVYFALSLFTAIHKPPMPCPCHNFMMHRPYMGAQFKPRGDFKGFEKGHFRDFRGGIEKGKMPKAPGEEQ